MGRRWWLVVGLIAAVVGCGSPARDEARESLVKQLKAGGLDQRTAECVVDAFFEGKTDEELKGFFDRPELTPEEAVEFAALGERCSPES
jgi:hypothetical protein